MRYSFLIVVLLTFLIGCSGGRDSMIMDPEKGLAYAMELYNDEDYLEAQKEFQSLVLQFPGSTITDDAQYYLGMS